MERKLVLKPFVLPLLYAIVVSLVVLFAVLITYNNKNTFKENLIYVSDEIIDNSIPVVGGETKTITILKPYVNNKVASKIKYYDYTAKSEEQESAIINYEGTYIQNSGVTYTCSESFDVVSVLDGTVTKVEKHELLGNTVEITHSNNVVSVYQMLDNVTVKVNDNVERGKVIAKSGTSNITTEKYNLHFELIKDGTIVNPTNYFDKTVNDLQ